MVASKVSTKVIVMDLECTCSEDTMFPNETTEIIQIGFCLYDSISKEITDKTSIIVKPDKTKITPYCTSLTGLTQEDVDKGVILQEACLTLIEKWKSHKRIGACYGKDVHFINHECTRKGIVTPFWLDKGFDIHSLFKIKTGQKKKTGLMSALKYYNLEFEGSHHDAMWDAYNTARLLKELLK